MPAPAPCCCAACPPLARCPILCSSTSGKAQMRSEWRQPGWRAGGLAKGTTAGMLPPSRQSPAHPPYAAASGKASRASRLSSQSCARVSSAGHFPGLRQEDGKQGGSHHLLGAPGRPRSSAVQSMHHCQQCISDPLLAQRPRSCTHPPMPTMHASLELPEHRTSAPASAPYTPPQCSSSPACCHRLDTRPRHW